VLRARSHDCEETPFTGDALQGMDSVLAKLETGACDQIRGSAGLLLRMQKSRRGRIDPFGGNALRRSALPRSGAVIRGPEPVDGYPPFLIGLTTSDSGLLADGGLAPSPL